LLVEQVESKKLKKASLKSEIDELTQLNNGNLETLRADIKNLKDEHIRLRREVIESINIKKLKEKTIKVYLDSTLNHFSKRKNLNY
jgi:hypothetical protein